ncbi:UBX domain-containing protein 4 [Genypterus blacodes]|uniref:UBX domain-containing protein 4 n=1 Tax=Genypterus blacodes TaxID=154954 RepID=UPI003F75B064
MLWFEGSIPAAIASSKQQNFIFVVVITGEDGKSADLMSSWEDDRVSDEAQNCCVAIKLDASSETCAQFSQIYPVVCVPASYFIGLNGTPLAVIGGSVSPEELMKRLVKVKQMHAQQAAIVMEEVNTQMESSLFDNVHTELVAGSEVHVSQGAAATTATEPRSATEDDSLSASGTPGDDGSTADEVPLCSQVEENVDAKVERLTKKLEERREQRKKGDEESEIKKEIERRKLGKDMVSYRKKQQEDNTKCLMEERNREKAEEKAARERVKQQIALDRAERSARYAKIQQEEKSARQAALQARQTEQEERKETQAKERSAIARIQFRLPDGSSVTNQFPSSSTLQEAQQFVVQEVGNRYGNFSLATMFPRHEFTSEELNRTLLELELAPSASMVLLPQSNRSPNTMVQSSGGGVWAILETILYPLLAVWRFLSTFLFVSPPPPRAATRGPARQPNAYTNSASASTDKPKRETVPKQKRTQDFKRDGKIYRLRNQDDSEDDNNTWNGNSTQQM